MNQLNVKLYLSLLAMLVLSACGGNPHYGHHLPEVKFDSDEIHPFANAGGIQFENRSPTGLTNLVFRGIEVDFNEVTQALIAAMSEELGLQGGLAGNAPSKTIAMEIKGIVLDGVAMTYASTVIVDVMLGNGEAFLVESHRSSYGSAYNIINKPTKPLDAAVSDTVALILNDPRLRAYVEQGD